MENYVGPDEIIQYGVDSLSEDAKMLIPVKDFVMIYKTMEELRRFFHNKDHFKKMETIDKYVGNKESGVYKVINHIYINRLDRLIDKDLDEKLDSEELNHPGKPFYFKIDS